MHGRGAYLGMDGKKFVGFWDANFNAGYGHITPPFETTAKSNQSFVRKSRYEAAWSVEGNFF